MYYLDSISAAIDALNSDGGNLENWDLDSGQAPYDEEGKSNDQYKGYEKCREQGKLKDCGPITRKGPGGDHPDDTVSVGSGSSTSETSSLDILYRLAPKKEKKWVLWLKAIQDANAEYSSLPLDAPAELRREKLDRLFQLAGQLNDPFDLREFSINNSQIFEEIQDIPDVAVLGNGYFEEMTILINRNHEPVKIVSINFTPEIFKKHPVLVIPSGGLYGLENSAFFKASLDEYVKQGGTLIVFSQQHGYEFSVLPVPQESDGTFKPLGGYGWSEDQSCFVNAAYIETWHQMLAGQNKSTPTLHLDGYFTTYPSNSTVILRRTANGQPALLIYEYGQGLVIATSMYSDFAHKQNQASLEEIALVRDMISWAKQPRELPEIKPGETVSSQIVVANNTATDAVSVKLHVYNPNRSTLITEQTVSVSTPAGQSINIPFSFTTTPTLALGIYHVDYTLFDRQGKTIQPQAETDSGRFVVSKPPITAYQPAKTYQLWVTSTAEYVFRGTEITFTVHIKNNTSQDFLAAKLGIGSHEARDEGGRWWIFHEAIEGINIPAGGKVEIPWTFRIDISQSVFFGLFRNIDNPNTYLVRGGLAWAEKGVRLIKPSLNISIQTDKTIYAKGEIVTIDASFKNNIAFSWQPNVQINVYDSRYNKIFEEAKTIALSPSGIGSVSTSFTLPPTSTIGNYWVNAWVSLGDWQYIGWASARYEITQSQILVSPNLPSVFNPGTNTIPFTISNTGKVNVSSGALALSLKGPDGGIVYSQSHPLALAVGETKTLDVPISIPSLKFGNYTLTYSQSDETREGRPTSITIPNTIAITPIFDKPSYKVRETVNLKVDLRNTGRFNLENLLISVSAPSVNYADTKIFSLGINSDPISFDFKIPIPETIPAGLQDVEITVALPSGNHLVKMTRFNVPASALSISHLDVADLKVGDLINISITNTGGLDTDITYKATLAGHSTIVAQNTGDDTLQADETKTYSLWISPQATNGTYILAVEGFDKKTLRREYFVKNLTVSGLRADLTVRTDRDLYLSSENVGVLSQIVNQTYGIENGHLHLQIVNKCGWGMPTSYHLFTWDGTAWVGRGTLRYPNVLETRLIDLSPYLPDPSGEYKVRIKHIGEGHAEIDYIGLFADGKAYGPSSALNLNTNENILFPVWEGDGWSAYVLNNEIEVRWTDVPVSTNLILLMRAQEGEAQYSPCHEMIYWQAVVPIAQAPNTTVNLSHMVSPLYESGQFYLQGTLLSQTGQVVSRAEYRFHVIDGDIGLRLHTDKPIYRVGETVRITGDAVNVSLIQANNITVVLFDNNWTEIYRETFNIPANGRHPFNFTLTAGPEGVYRLLGVAYQNMSWLGSVFERYEVAFPGIHVTTDAPSMVGNREFPLSVTLENVSKIPATVQMFVTGGTLSDTRTISLAPSETKLIQYTQSIITDTTYTIEITGDLDEVITQTVSYGLGASMQFGAGSSELGIFPEGSVAIPITLTNTGQLAGTLEVTYQLNPGGTQQTKTYSLLVGGSTTDTLYFNLTEGDYQVTATGQRPDATAQANFSVRKENQVEITVSLGTQTDGLIPVNINLTNLGFNEISGSVNVNVTGGLGQIVWNGEEPLSQLLPQSSQLINFTINPSAIEPGIYTLQTQLLNHSNQVIATRSLEFGIQSANFQITQLPPYQTFMPGEEATFVFRVKNIGDQEGSFDLRFKAYDLIDSTQREWLKAGEEKTLSFGFMLPEDLEEKDYFATYELKASKVAEQSRGQIKYHLAGININVNATLDKPHYNEGETAQLTISIQSPNVNPQNLFARVNYAGYEPQQTFTLSGNQVLIFDIPLPKITGEKLFYGIYHEGGRSIHLNSLYIHKAGDVITITTDKQVYQPGETVTVSVTGNVSGNMTLSRPGGFTEAFPFTGQAIRTFTLPSTMAAGTYFINAQLSTETLNQVQGDIVTVVHPFDVAGIQVKVLECNNDKGKYASSDTITTSLTISSNTTLPAILKAWIVDPTGQYTSVGEQTITLSSSENLLVTHQSSLMTSVAGIHRLVYGIYGPEDLLLCSGSEAFDVGDAVLMGISTDKRDYPTNTEPVIVTASLLGSVNAELQLELDGVVIKTETISLNGFTSYTTQLQNITPGPHTLKATLTAGGLNSTKETSFTYALALMPRPQISASPAYLDFGSLNLGSTATQTINLSSTGNADLVIGMIALSGTNQGEFSIQNDTCSGRPVAPSATCTLDVLFSPTSPGLKSASLFIPSNATDVPTLYVPLEGTGITTLTLDVLINPMGGGRVTGTGIDCPGDCTESFSTPGATIELTATPVEGYQFVNWTGEINSPENPITITMDTHKNVTANFVVNTYTITATAGLGGAISPAGFVTVNHGANQTFIIIPNAGHHIVDVRVNDVSMGAKTTHTFSHVTSAHTIEAIFAINQYTLTATAGLNGTISPSGAITVSYGASQTFTITPDTGYRILDVRVDGISVGPVTNFTFNSVASHHTIEASFEVRDNHLPVAEAGPDQNVRTGEVVTLDGSESYDPEGAMITFLWTFVEVPPGSSVTNGSLSDITSAKPRFTPDVNGAYRLQLIVNDGALGSVPDEVVIYASAPNVPPNANAGPDQNVYTGSPVQLDGSRSSDPDNGPLPLAYLWSIVTKPTGSMMTDHAIVNRNLPDASFIPDVNGLYELRLTVNDGHLSSEDTVLIMATIPNIPPNADAGPDRTIYLGNVVVLNGSASNDPDQGPQPLTYLWSFVAVPTGSQLTNGHLSGANTVSASFTPDVIGTYVLQLMVYDGIEAGFDNVAVTVVDTTAPKLAPVANKTILWPPNHQMVDITIWANASDNSGGPVRLQAVVSSNEPQEGLGDGDRSPDWTEPVINQHNGVITLKLRAERSGRGTGRIYTITINATDASGNRSQAKVEIKVPHNR